MTTSETKEQNDQLCVNCSQALQGRLVEWRSYAASGQMKLDAINSLVCQNCGAEYCSICHPQKIKLNLFTGYEAVVCPACGQKFGPGSARLKPETDSSSVQNTAAKKPITLDVQLWNIQQTNTKAFTSGIWGLLLIAAGIFLMLQGNLEGDDSVTSWLKYLPIILLLGGGGIVINALKPLLDLKKNRLIDCANCGKSFPINNRWIFYSCQNCGSRLRLNLLNIQFNRKELDAMATCNACHSPNEISTREVFTTCPSCKQKVPLANLQRYV